MNITRRQLLSTVSAIPVVVALDGCNLNTSNVVTQVQAWFNAVVTKLTSMFGLVSQVWPAIQQLVSQLSSISGSLNLSNIAQFAQDGLSILAQLATILGPLVPGLGPIVSTAGLVVQAILGAIPTIISLLEAAGILSSPAPAALARSAVAASGFTPLPPDQAWQVLTH